MKFTFEIRRADDPNFIPHPKSLLAMSERSFEACEHWLTEALAGRATDPNWLTLDLNYVRLASAASGMDLFGSFIAFRTLDRSPRLVTPAQFCFMRLLSLPGRSCAWYFGIDSKKNLPPELKRYYLAYGNRGSGNIYGLRILYNAKAGEVMQQRIKKPIHDHRGHYDLRPHNIWRTTRAMLRNHMRNPLYGRADAIDYAVAAFGAGVEHLRLGRDGYRSLLEKAALHLDQANSFPVR